MDVLCINILDTDFLKVKKDWQLIWQLKIPPKVKRFLWRAGREVLPSRQCLQSKGIFVPLIYVMYEKEVENYMHGFAVCPFAMKCWHEINLHRKVVHCAADVNCSVNWLFNMLHDLDGAIGPKFAMVFWCIWKQRNSELWNDVFDDDKKVVYGVL